MKNQHLENLSIFELRDLARKIGVFNPTVLKKQDLILAIYDIQTGKTKPHVSKTRQGRPPKSIGVLDNIVNIFLPEDILTIPTREEAMYDKPKEIEFASEPDEPTGNEPSFVYKGYLEILNNGCGLLRKKLSTHQKPTECVYVLSKHMSKFKFRNGDEILCKAVFVEEERPLVLYEVNEINGVSVENYRPDRRDYDLCSYDIKTKNIEFKTAEMQNVEAKVKLQYGDTIFCHHSNSIDFKSFVFGLIENEKDAFDNYIYLSPSTTPKGYEILKNSKAELYYCDFNDSFMLQERLSFLAHNRAKRLAEQGKNVCFIVDDIKALVSIDKGDIDELARSKKILSIAKNTDNGSVTIICSMPPIPDYNLGNFIKTTFTVIENVALFIEDKKINLDKSYRM